MFPLMATKEIIQLLLILNFSCCYFLSSHCLLDTDTILQGQQLRDWEQLNSANKVFRLQFFSPSNSNSRYIGVFYNIPPNLELYAIDERAVWVANRNTPIPDASGYLMVDTDGLLQISYSEGNTTLSNTATARINASATLLDSGNFVLRELNSDGSINRVLWQSFDYPTDTLLPGMKLGINFKTGHKWSFNSWISDSVPASGSFTLGGDPNGTSQLVLWWRGNISWTSGLWRNGHFDRVHKFLNRSDTYNFNFVANEDEKYLTYSMKKNHTWPRFTMSQVGTIDERGRGDTWFSCFDRPSYPGCVNYQLPKCRKTKYWFDRQKGFTLSEGFKFDESSNMSLFDCQVKCQNNCSCVTYASTNNNGTGCEIWTQLPDFSAADGSSSRDFYILRSGKGNKWWTWLIVGVGALVILLLCCSFYLVRRKLKVKRNTKINQKMLYNKANHHKKYEMMSHELRLFSFEDIEAATNNFSSTNKIGEGGFGPVYKGKLLDGQEVAIKRLSRSSAQGLVEFKNEILLIAKLQHANLVRLLGWCLQGEENVLVYEYMPNKSLDFILFDPSKKEILKWTNRFNIIEGIAQGLLYLHKYSRPIVIHRDLKASNILLDDKLNPKISDFGMAKRFGLNESEENTNRVVGTYGYMSPEYAMKGTVSTKIDVFSFGVLLLEIVSGKKNNRCYRLEQPLNLIGLVWEMWKEDRALELMDLALEDSCPCNEVMRCIHIGLLCVQDRAIDRPSMSEVVSMLKSEIVQLRAPKQPAFFIEVDATEAAIDSKLGNCSINRVTLSKMKAR